MKSILISLFLLISINVRASEKRIYTKLNSREARVVIATSDIDLVQAASYVDGYENEKFINDMLNDKNSILFKLKSEIEKESCIGMNKVEREECGHVTLTSEVKTSFGRNGWMSAGGSYTFFVGFTFNGTGRFFEATHMVVISETAEAQVKKDGKYSGVITKSLYLVKIKKIDDVTP